MESLTKLNLFNVIAAFIHLFELILFKFLSKACRTILAVLALFNFSFLQLRCIKRERLSIFLLFSMVEIDFFYFYFIVVHLLLVFVPMYHHLAVYILFSF